MILNIFGHWSDLKMEVLKLKQHSGLEFLHH